MTKTQVSYSNALTTRRESIRFAVFYLRNETEFVIFGGDGLGSVCMQQRSKIDEVDVRWICENSDFEGVSVNFKGVYMSFVHFEH